jgi:hypothetical protein
VPALRVPASGPLDSPTAACSAACGGTFGLYEGTTRRRYDATNCSPRRGTKRTKDTKELATGGGPRYSLGLIDVRLDPISTALQLVATPALRPALAEVRVEGITSRPATTRRFVIPSTLTSATARSAAPPADEVRRSDSQIFFVVLVFFVCFCAGEPKARIVVSSVVASSRRLVVRAEGSRRRRA